jgi:histidinol-phosphate aminotransferase
LAQAAGLAALAAPGWVARSRAHNAAERTRIAAALGNAGITTHPSEANFVLADFGGPVLAAVADAHLQASGIIVRRVGGYGLPNCLRITVGLTEENDILIEALSRFGATHHV